MISKKIFCENSITQIVTFSFFIEKKQEITTENLIINIRVTDTVQFLSIKLFFRYELYVLCKFILYIYIIRADVQ